MTSTPIRPWRSASAIAHSAYAAPHTPAASQAAFPAPAAPARCSKPPATRPDVVTASSMAATCRASHGCQPKRRTVATALTLYPARRAQPESQVSLPEGLRP